MMISMRNKRKKFHQPLSRLVQNRLRHMAMWLYGYVAMWLCGYVAMWISSNIFIFFECQICKDNIVPGYSHILSNIL